MTGAALICKAFKHDPEVLLDRLTKTWETSMGFGMMTRDDLDIASEGLLC
jgi:hypothetical protein